MPEIVAVCISDIRGTRKREVPYIDVKENFGIVGDAHAGNWHRQISLLAEESVDKMRALGIKLNPGDFAENILTRGIVLNTLKIGTVLSVGEAKLKITQIGKKCHNDCEIKAITGKCVMPTEGVFAIVVKEGRIKHGDKITVSEENNEAN